MITAYVLLMTVLPFTAGVVWFWLEYLDRKKARKFNEGIDKVLFGE